MSSTTDDARDRLRKTIEAYATREGIVASYVSTGVSDEMIEVAATKRENAYAFVSEAIDALVARAREEGAREGANRAEEYGRVFRSRGDELAAQSFDLLAAEMRNGLAAIPPKVAP
jgi:hypothetical protein